MKITFVQRLLSDAEYDEKSGNFLRKDLPAGSVEWARNETGAPSSLLFVCPCGCGWVNTVPLNPPNGQGWKFNGNRELPTLQPSILIFETDGKTQHWHGFLTNGEWLKC